MSLTQLDFTWEGGFVTTCWVPTDLKAVRRLLARPLVEMGLLEVQSGKDGPLDTLVNPAMARYIVLSHVTNLHADD